MKEKQWANADHVYFLEKNCQKHQRPTDKPPIIHASQFQLHHAQASLVAMYVQHAASNIVIKLTVKSLRQVPHGIDGITTGYRRCNHRVVPATDASACSPVSPAAPEAWCC